MTWIVDRLESPREIGLADLLGGELVGVRVSKMLWQAYDLDHDECMVHLTDGSGVWMRTCDIAEALWPAAPSWSEVMRVYRQIWQEDWRWDQEHDDWGLTNEIAAMRTGVTA